MTIVHNAIQNHVTAVATQATVGATIAMHYFNWNDIPVYLSVFTGVCGLILQGIYVFYSVRNKTTVYKTIVPEVQVTTPIGSSTDTTKN